MNTDLETSEPEITTKKRISMIWIMPIVALFIGLGMIYHNWQNQGIIVEVKFQTAQGLESGKTKLKNRNVDIGTVESIKLSPDRSAVLVKIEVDKEMRDFLRRDSAFWVVRPRVGAAGVSGIGTLLSGAYIQISPGKNDEFSRDFIGLEAPPISEPNTEGLQLRLISDGGKPLKVGNPVLYRGFQVGAVEAVEFDTESRMANYLLFIHAPYDALVTTNTFFWNASGMSISTAADGFRVDFDSLESVLSGGVEFDVPEDLTIGRQITETRTFKLYETEKSILEEREYEFLEFILLVENSVGGLYKGAPVEYRGIRIGTVAQPYIGFDRTFEIDPETDRIPVLIHIEPRRFAHKDRYDMQWFEEQFRSWIYGGLQARIENANLITGSLKVSMDATNNTVTEIDRFGPYTVIPVREGGFASLSNKAENLLTKLESLPIEVTVANANAALKNAEETFLILDSTLASLEKVMQGLQPDSVIYRSLETNLSELDQTLDALQPLIQEISNKPNSLVFSEALEADIEPRGKQYDE